MYVYKHVHIRKNVYVYVHVCICILFYFLRPYARKAGPGAQPMGEEDAMLVLCAAATAAAVPLWAHVGAILCHLVASWNFLVSNIGPSGAHVLPILGHRRKVLDHPERKISRSHVETILRRPKNAQIHVLGAGAAALSFGEGERVIGLGHGSWYLRLRAAAPCHRRSPPTRAASD